MDTLQKNLFEAFQGMADDGLDDNDMETPVDNVAEVKDALKNVTHRMMFGGEYDEIDEILTEIYRKYGHDEAARQIIQQYSDALVGFFNKAKELCGSDDDNVINRVNGIAWKSGFKGKSI